MLKHSVLAHPRLISQKVIPHDRGPASGQLAHVGNNHQWQRTRLEEFTRTISKLRKQQQQAAKHEVKSTLLLTSRSMVRPCTVKQASKLRE